MRVCGKGSKNAAQSSQSSRSLGMLGSTAARTTSTASPWPHLPAACSTTIAVGGGLWSLPAMPSPNS
jgi:hypothetical protein